MLTLLNPIYRLIHISDWLPTLYTAIGGDVSDLGAIDGVDQWDTISRDLPSKRTEMLYNIELQEGKYLGAFRLFNLFSNILPVQFL